jgi:hypothetical protein
MFKIRMDVDGTTITITLDDNPSSRDFLSLLPLTLSLEDYAKTEKVSDLPRKLAINGAPAGMTPAVGDVTYYAPWGNLAIFYKNFGYAAGLVKLGRIDSGMTTLLRAGPFKATISLVND